MGHEFSDAEMMPCTRCGEWLPGDIMTFLSNGEVLCPDCYNDLLREEEKESEIAENEEPEYVQEQDPLENLFLNLDRMSAKLSFVEQLPDDLKLEFVTRMRSQENPFDDGELMARTVGTRIRSFNAIDFETANENPSSICSIGIVFVRDGKVVDRYYSLVHPEPEYYAPVCQRVHGLGPADTDSAPNFQKAWNKIRSKIEEDDYPLVAHNSPFDEGCLKAAFQTYRMDYPDYRFLDTLKVSRRHFGKSLPNHQLQTVAAACGYDLTKHHHALADAEACAAIALKIMPSELLDL